MGNKIKHPRAALVITKHSGGYLNLHGSGDPPDWQWNDDLDEADVFHDLGEAIKLLRRVAENNESEGPEAPEAEPEAYFLIANPGTVVECTLLEVPGQSKGAEPA